MSLLSITPSKHFLKLIKDVRPEFLKHGSVLSLQDLKILMKERPDVCFHELLQESQLILPQPPKHTRNPELEERIKKLEAEKANRDYFEMTKNLGYSGKKTSSVASEVKATNAMIAVVINFVLTVAGSFVFAFKALEYAMQEPNIPAQVLLGICVSSIVAVADLYFIVKDL